MGWCLMIFGWSHQTGEESQAVSEVIAGEINDGNQVIGFFVRKAAHLFEYLVLGILIMLFINTFSLNNKYQLMIAIIFCVLYALSDEFHQTFVSGRFGTLVDVLIDSGGSLLGIALTSVFYYFKYQKFRSSL